MVKVSRTRKMAQNSKHASHSLKWLGAGEKVSRSSKNALK